ncbi:MAG: hypothetical protein PVH29_09885 [Candidatus Zixiibacteriota bacterium]|jgi:hypothetical protein
MNFGLYNKGNKRNGRDVAASIAGASVCRIAKEYKKASPVRTWLRAAGARVK